MRYKRRVFQETGHLVRLRQVAARLGRFGGFEESRCRAARCVSPAKDCVQIVSHQHVTITGQVLKQDEIVSDAVTQAGFTIIKKRVDSEEAKPVVHVDRCFYGCDKFFLGCFGQEPAQPNQV